MWIGIVFSILITATRVFLYTEDKPATGEAPALENIHVSPFLFGNESIRLNITWEEEFGHSTVDDIFIEVYDARGDCIYSSYEYITNSSLIIPSLDVTFPFEELYLSCDYKIIIEFEKNGVILNYSTPECIGTLCVCISQRTNLIKLINMEWVDGFIYKVYYTSENTSLEKGNYYVSNVSYVKETTYDEFHVSKLKYLKGAFEIPMEYLMEGENYTLIVHYRDADNINPKCLYKSTYSFQVNFHSKDDKNYLLIYVVSIFILLFTALILICVFVKWSVISSKTIVQVKKCLFPDYADAAVIENLQKASFNIPHQEINVLYTPLDSPENSYEFPRHNLVIKDVIGEGAFGKVYYAKAYNLNGVPGFTMVAVKLLREGAPKEELSDFQAEINMLKKIGHHKNVVKFLGCVTKSQPFMTIMELVLNGDLKEYLLKLRNMWVKNKNQRLFFPDDMEEKSLNESGTKSDTDGITRFDADMQTPLLSEMGVRPEPVLDHTELENFALQIATGMAYLEKIPVTHRDLAARNVLITKDKVLKISDFGMSRSGPYVNRHLKKVPLRWMAIEAIEDFKTDSKSDVWSFGVVLWEIGTLGAFPYEDIPNDLLPKALKSGERLPRPEICTDDLYDLMQKCWLENPKDRPTFADIVEHFNFKKHHVYVDFTRVNPNYMFPPTYPE